MSARQALRRYWDSALAVAAAVCAALWVTPAVINLVSTEIIAFFTIQAAVILPAMIFTAGLLRGQGLTLAEVDRYQGALRRQMHFWVTLLFLDLLAVTLIIVGKAANWRWKVSIEGHSADIVWILVFSGTFVSALAVLRMIPFVRGVVSLMELNGLLVRKSVEAAVAESPSQEVRANPEPLDLPDGYGKILPHPRKRRNASKR
ncbi:hypothetical protein IVB08_16840 [Bradyrhizobium sp. 173]|uniref:hypothetical protein n=1 Tax=Bradyrhizobium sp. 173 TaxID=2782644 RepID=UPI001FFC1ACE|nr:hypothetical protein [Bradyrhizobium sp. 173]MCK1565609.1 hypothetical protein [Bradyrhizobium sp. 173]